MQLEELIPNLKTLLIDFSDDNNTKQNTNLTNLFNSLNFCLLYTSPSPLD